MKTELKAKFIQHLLGKKKDNEGFTLIELLVVIIIIGILSAIALPSFLNQAAKAKQSEAKTYIGSVNRAQQSYRIENPSFASDFTALQIGIPTQTTNYIYAILNPDTVQSTVTATSQDAASLKSFSGGVVVLTSGQSSAVACQSTGVTTTPPNLTLNAGANAACADGENMK
ncbi:type IV pilin-like G/H family protein [Dolichospermum sp. ST_sed1]|nr:type IV pilin-like G/H family protein [Dolichospermum sp. ST_sed1]MDD1423529.1 type IV pilin-like G/H family protein [Dolichospermum sp. ST_sed9]MDD1432291.1 type IV pilin-like G/H family protein [Dolichospermum sp. ST_sed6]MDD1434931.1 type IV pilin-like G/H family protein [Dolichospermum sp. ST_sed10]MDD1438992.1 type IV pilin-like G/H family protein [Dolichospermum sp. ST_sed3]MDD1445303.1 type IV pilin-like G/H family protein [Dolichospermum sp. ST_sed8]MDD1454051.1 type IV pilin-like 